MRMGLEKWIESCYQIKVKFVERDTAWDSYNHYNAKLKV